MACGPLKFSPICSGRSRALAISALPAIVVVPDRLFQPRHALGLQRATALEGVDHGSTPGCSRPSAARCPAGAGAPRASLARSLARLAWPRRSLTAWKPPSSRTLGLVGGSGRTHQPESARVVGRQRPRCAAEQRRQRHAGSDGERVPQGDVQRRQRHAHDAGDADQGETPLELGRRWTVAPRHRRRPARPRLAAPSRSRARRCGGSRTRTSVPVITLLGLHIDQQQRRRSQALPALVPST